MLTLLRARILTPGGGSVAAYVGALAAALVTMVARLTLGRERYAAAGPLVTPIAERGGLIASELEQLAIRDAEAYAQVSDAYKRPKTTDTEIADRHRAIQDALIGAARIPLTVARLCHEIAGMADAVATHGNSNAITDAGTAALLAHAACAAADYNVRINTKHITDLALATTLGDESRALARATEQLTLQVRSRVEAALV